MNENQFLENEKQQDGVAFKTLFYLLKKNIIMICIVTFLFTVLGFVYGKYVQKPTYSASTTAVVQADNSNMTEYNAFVYAQYLVNSMAEFIVSDSVTYEVAKEVVDKKLGITKTVDDEGNTKIYSSSLKKELTNDEYQKQVLAKRSQVKSGTRISTNTESLIININYSSVEVDENTADEVLHVISLLVDKTKEVALTLKNETPTYVFPETQKKVATNAVTKALIKKYSLEAVYENDEIIAYKSTVNSEYFTKATFDSMVASNLKILMETFIVSYVDGALQFSIRNIETSKGLDEEIALYCLVDLNNYARENPQDKYVEEYLYPTFANKLVEMGGTPTYANKSTKTMLFTALAFIIGVIASCGVILIKYLLDDTFTSKEDIENLTGANVLAFVEKFELKEEE